MKKLRGKLDLHYNKIDKNGNKRGRNYLPWVFKFSHFVVKIDFDPEITINWNK